MVKAKSEELLLPVEGLTSAGNAVAACAEASSARMRCADATGRFTLIDGLSARGMAQVAWQLLRRQRNAIVGPPAQRGATTGRLAPDPNVFFSCPGTRADSEASRIVYVGDLSPRSGIADFLSCAIAWAECHPDIDVEICWLGQGDLLGILHAQLLPSNLAQTFAHIPARAELATVFARCGLLAAPSLSRDHSLFVAEAMAAGLLVLGSARSAEIRGLVADGQTGWLFDPVRPEQISAALDAALTATPARLDKMRAAARARACEVGLSGIAPLSVRRDGALVRA